MRKIFMQSNVRGKSFVFQILKALHLTLFPWSSVALVLLFFSWLVLKNRREIDRHTF
jgi:hypothetical protein